MTLIKDFPNPVPPGLTLAIEANGINLVNEGGVYKATDAAAAQAVIDAYDPMPYATTEAKAALADHRWKVETGGVVFMGHPVSTTRESQGTITAAFIVAQGGQLPNGVGWKGLDGAFFHITPQQVAQLYATVAAHVQACFAREAELVALIDAAQTWEEVAAIDVTAGFPSNP